MASLSEAADIRAGKIAPSRFYPAPAKVDVRAIRAGLGLSQVQFARRLGFAPAILASIERFCMRNTERTTTGRTSGSGH